MTVYQRRAIVLKYFAYWNAELGSIVLSWVPVTQASQRRAQQYNNYNAGLHFFEENYNSQKSRTLYFWMTSGFRGFNAMLRFNNSLSTFPLAHHVIWSTVWLQSMCFRCVASWWTEPHVYGLASRGLMANLSVSRSSILASRELIWNIDIVDAFAKAPRMSYLELTDELHTIWVGTRKKIPSAGWCCELAASHC